jgi:pimeloyl-ACP methyl ester carboxylesterase
LTKKLASKGYFVVSIQHELPTDDLLPLTGIPQVVRRSNWERGVENILFVIKKLKITNPDLDYKHLILIGHSNGGDMTVLFTHKYPNLVDKTISLDNRRMELPRTSQPKIYSLRSSDQPADKGVLPTLTEQEKFGIKIIKLANTIHNDMNDRGNKRQKREINTYIMGFLTE